MAEFYRKKKKICQMCAGKDVDYKDVAIVSKYCKKGSLVGVTGRIQTGSYQAQDGTTRYTTDVVADNVRFLSSKNSGSSEAMDDMPDYSNGDEASVGEDLTEDPYKDFGSEVVLSDDDLPF